MQSSPSQQYIPSSLHLLLKDTRDKIFIYSTNPNLAVPVAIVKSIFQAMKEDFLYTDEIEYDSSVSFKDQIESEFSSYHRNLPDGGVFVVVIDNENVEEFLEIFYEYFKDYIDEDEIISDVFTIYLFDNFHTHFDPKYEGHYVYSSYMNTENTLQSSFEDNIENINEDVFPTSSDAAIVDATRFILQLLEDSDDLSYETLKNQIYYTEIDGLLAEKIKIDETNRIIQNIYYGTISKNGDLEYVDTVTKEWYGEPYRNSINRIEYYTCDWKDKKQDLINKNFIILGVILPSSKVFRYEGLIFYSSLCAVADNINMEGGVNDKMIILYLTSDGDDPESAYNTLKELTKNNIFIFFGGWEKEIKDKLNEAAIETNSIVFYPRDYEGEECHYNGFYSGISYTSYYSLIPQIVSFDSGSTVLLYTDNYHSQYFAEHIIEDLKYFNIEIKLSLEVISEVTEMDYVTDLISHVTPRTALILNLLEGDAQLDLIIKLHEKGLVPPNFKLISFNCDDQTFHNIGKDESGKYYADGMYYFDSIKDDRSNTEIQKYINNFNKMYTHFGNMNYLALRAVVISQIVVNIAKSGSGSVFSYENLRKGLYNIETDTVIGRVKFDTSNNLENILYLKEVSENSEGVVEIEYIYDADSVINHPYGNIFRKEPVYLCDYKNGENMINIEIKRIAVLLSTSGIYEEEHSNALIGAITALKELFDEDYISNSVLFMELMEYNSDEELLKENLAKLDADNSIVAYVGCTTALCKKNAQEAANRTNRLFFYPRLTSGQECDYYTFYTSTVASQYVSRLLEYLLSTQYDNALYIIREESTAAENMEKIINDAASGLFTIKGNFAISDSTPLTVKATKEIIEKLDNSGIIITLFTATKYLSMTLEYFSKIHIDYEKYAIVDLLLEMDHLSSIPSKYLKNLYKISRYFYDEPNDSNTIFKSKIYHYTGRTNPTSLTEGTYSSIMLLADAARKANSFDSDEIRKYIYTTSIESGSGIVTISDNNYATSPFFVAKYDENGEKYSTIHSKYDMQVADPWSWNIEATYGLKCSFNGENKQEYKVPVKRTLLVASLSGDEMDDTDGLIDIYQIVVNEINNENGIGGYTIKADVLDIQSNVNYCKEQLPDYINNDEIVAVFGSIPNECFEAIQNNINENDILYFELNKRAQGFCAKHTLVAVKHASFYDSIMNVIANRLYDNILIVTETRNLNQYDNSIYVQGYLTNRYVDFIEYTDNYISSSVLLEKLNEYNSKVESKGCIIYFGHLTSFEILMSTLKLNSFNEPKHHVIVMENSHLFVPLGYYDYEVFEFYNPNDDSELNNEFRTKVYERLDTSSIISDLMIRTYSSMKLWYSAINTLEVTGTDLLADISADKVRTAMINHKIETPEGKVYFAVNQYLSRTPMLLKLNQDKTYTTEYIINLSIKPVAWPLTNNNEYRICDFTNTDILEDSVVNTYSIAIVLSLSGSDRSSETPIYDAVAAAIDEINSGTLLIDYYIHYKLYDAKSDSDEYERIIKDLVNGNVYTYIFAGYKADTLPKIAPLFDEKNKFLFFLGRVMGDDCYKNAIISHYHPKQIADATIRKLLEISTSAFIVKSQNEYYSNIADHITKIMENLLITSNGNVEYSTGTRVANAIIRSIPNGGYIITVLSEDDIIELYPALCTNDIKSPKYTIINVNLNENTAKKIESNCLSGSIVMGTYFENMESTTYNNVGVPSSASTFNEYFHIRTGDIRATGDYEAAYDSLILWKSIVNKMNTFDFEKIKEIYHYPVDVPSNKIEVNVNNYFKRKIYSGEINNEGEIIINWVPDSLFTPKIYDQNNNDEIGYVCDWSDISKGKHYFEDPIILSFLHEKDFGGKTEKYNTLLEDTIIEEINNVGGVLGKKLASNHTWLTINDAYRNTRSIVEVGRSNVIFGCINAECRSEVSRYLSDKKQLYFFTGRDDGNQCSDNTITTALSINQKIDIISSYLGNIDITGFYIVGSERNSYIIYIFRSYTEKYLIEEMFDKLGLKLLGFKFFSPFNSVQSQNATDEIISYLDDMDRVGCIIILFSNKSFYCI